MKNKEEDNKYSKKTYEYEWKRIWEYHKEADHLFHQRFNFFLVAESMLIVSFMTLLNSSHMLVMIAIILLGLVYTFGWLYVNTRINYRIEYLKEFLIMHDEIYRNYMDCVDDSLEDRDNPEKTIHFQVYVLPKMTFLFWFFLLFNIVMKLNIFFIIIFLLVIYFIVNFILKKTIIPIEIK